MDTHSRRLTERHTVTVPFDAAWATAATGNGEIESPEHNPADKISP